MLWGSRSLAALAIFVAGGLVSAQHGFAEGGAKVDYPPYPEKGLKGLVKAERLPVSDHPVIRIGAEIWDRNCRICHGTGNFGTPKITGSKFWAPRIAQGLPVLFSHAINGFLSPSGGNMPAKGGNEDLSDADVQAAVRFMVYHSGGADIAVREFD
jgi:cytochrome c5